SQHASWAASNRSKRRKPRPRSRRVNRAGKLSKQRFPSLLLFAVTLQALKRDRAAHQNILAQGTRVVQVAVELGERFTRARMLEHELTHDRVRLLRLRRIGKESLQLAIDDGRLLIMTRAAELVGLGEKRRWSRNFLGGETTRRLSIDRRRERSSRVGHHPCI